MHVEDEDRFEMTLDPPGKIVIVGAGPLGLEAALYGRYLGYEVEIFEKGAIGQSLRARQDDQLPMLPDRCLSPLAISALKAQDGGLLLPGDPTFPQTIGQWIENGLMRIASTDLLSGRVHCENEVISLQLVEDAEPTETPEQESLADDESYIDGEVPPDFRLGIRNGDTVRMADTEAVIIAMGPAARSSIEGLDGFVEAPYLFEIGRIQDADDEATLHRGWREIVMVFAGLGGRRSLDLYRPQRS